MPRCTLCKRDFKDLEKLVCHFYGDHDLDIKRVRSAIRKSEQEIAFK